MFQKVVIISVILITVLCSAQPLDMDRLKGQSKPDDLGVSGSAVQTGLHRFNGKSSN